MNNISRPTSQRWAIVLLGVAALALGACGRKGPLDLPPGASSQAAESPVAAAPSDTEAERAAQPGVFNPTYGTDAPPTAPKGRKRAFVLDPLLD